jgi:hypothetical protein
MIEDGLAQAGDHDFHCVNFTPSVNLIVDVEHSLDPFNVEEVLNSFYRGIYPC